MIAVEDLRFAYGHDEPIIDRLSFPFPAGRVTAITGSSGSGKSTLLYLLGLLLTPVSGRILFDGHDLGTRSDRVRSVVRAKTVGFVFQDAALDPTRTVLDNIVEAALYAAIPRRQAVIDARSLMERFEVALRAGYRPGEVSGGQAQRIALCRALVKNPSVILADEPTGNLDARTSRVVVGALADAAHERHATVVIATHDPDVVSACDRVLELGESGGAWGC